MAVGDSLVAEVLENTIDGFRGWNTKRMAPRNSRHILDSQYIHILILIPQILTQSIRETLSTAVYRQTGLRLICVLGGHVNDGWSHVSALSCFHVWPEEPCHEDERKGVEVYCLEETFVAGFVELRAHWIHFFNVIDEDGDILFSTGLFLDILTQFLIFLPVVVFGVVKAYGLNLSIFTWQEILGF